ncbi:MAG: hypothetical protein N2246_00985 [Candidatus Sumerlaeia bacterium]|nr:hypothetical protein [Candidatus Sumerlaeia bacterium]
MRYWKISIIIVCLCLSSVIISNAKEMEPLGNGLIRIYKTLNGTDESALIEQAGLEAVENCVGRIYSSQNLIMARDLLEKYLKHNYKKFIYTIEVLDKYYSKNNIYLTLHIYVRYDELKKDLLAKRFLYKPRYRPYFGLFVAEQIDGQPATELLAQKEIRNLLQERGVRLMEHEMIYLPTNVDVTRTPELLNKAIESANKNGIELIISGESSTQLVKQEQLYYDKFYFYETTIKLKLVRVDTGEILLEQEANALSYSRDLKNAIATSVSRAAQTVTNALVDYYLKVWDKIFLNQTDYQIMLTGVDEEGLHLLTQRIQQLHPQTEVFKRAFYRNTAVLNIVYPGPQDDLQYLLQTSPYPSFRIVKIAKAYIEAQREH